MPVGNEGSLKSSHGFTWCCDGNQQKTRADLGAGPCWYGQSRRRNPAWCPHVLGSSQAGSSLISPRGLSKEGLL